MAKQVKKTEKELTNYWENVLKNEGLESLDVYEDEKIIVVRPDKAISFISKNPSTWKSKEEYFRLLGRFVNAKEKFFYPVSKLEEDFVFLLLAGKSSREIQQALSISSTRYRYLDRKIKNLLLKHIKTYGNDF